MTAVTHPDKSAVRAYTQQRAAAQRSADRPAPPTPEEIRRQLSWHMEPNNKSAECAR